MLLEIMKSRLHLWILLITHSGLGGLVCCGEVEFLEELVGGSVVFPCVCETQSPAPIGVYLKRKWLLSKEVLFMYTNDKPSMINTDDDTRISVRGDPASSWLNVTISHLRISDTDRYYCEFVIEDNPEDRRVPGQTEFLLYVHDDVPWVDEIGQIETCVGGSAVLPCLSPHASAGVEGVTLKRRKGRAPVETLYHPKYHFNHADSSAPSSSSSSSVPSSRFPTERFVMSMVPGPRGMGYNITMLHLQPEDSAVYSCQLLVPGRPDSSSSLGRRVFVVSVQGGPCGCSSYENLLYAMSAAAALLLILIVMVMVYKGKARDRVKPQPQGAIYEEMVGVRPPARKVAPCHLDTLHLEETDCSLYSNTNSQVTFRPENHYEKTSSTCSPMEDEE